MFIKGLNCKFEIEYENEKIHKEKIFRILEFDNKFILNQWVLEKTIPFMKWVKGEENMLWDRNKKRIRKKIQKKIIDDEKVRKNLLFCSVPQEIITCL